MKQPKRGQYRSAFEFNLATKLYEAGIDFQYEPYQLKYELPMNNSYCAECECKEIYSTRKYVPDFILPNGLVIEAKGEFTSQNRKKMLAIIESNPDLDIRMVFMRDNYLSKKHANKYSDWCERNGVTYAVGDIPEEWTK